MSQHHRRSKHSSKSAALRKVFQQQLPMPCVNCGGAVIPGDKWEVGHIVPASQGGQTTLSNTGPAHYRCQRLEGGRLGSRIVNGHRQAQKDIRPW